MEQALPISTHQIPKDVSLIMNYVWRLEFIYSVIFEHVFQFFSQDQGIKVGNSD